MAHTHTFMHNALVIKNGIIHGKLVIVNLEIFNIEELSYINCCTKIKK